MPSRELRRAGAEGVRAELEAVLRVAHPVAGGLHPFAAVDGRQRAEHGHEVALAADLHAQHGETVLLVEERDALDLAFDLFHAAGNSMRPACHASGSVLLSMDNDQSLRRRTSRIGRSPSSWRPTA